MAGVREEGIDVNWNQTSTDVVPPAPPEPSPVASPDVAPPGPAASPVLEPPSMGPASAPSPRRSRRVLFRAAIVAGLLLGIGALGFFLVTTLGQLDTARKGEASLRAQLGSTNALLSATKSELVTADDASAARQQIDNYAGTMFSNVGALQKNLNALADGCPGSACSADLANVESAASLLQAGGTTGLKVPPVLAPADAEIRSAADEYVKGAKLLVSSVDAGNQSTLLNAISTLSEADASLATAVSDIGNVLLGQS